MTAIGLRVGPFEILGRTAVPEPGDWHLAQRTGMTRRQPHDVLVRLLPPDASADERQALHRQFEVLKALEDPRIPEAIAFYEGLGALALAAVDGVSLRDIVAKRRHDQVGMSPATLLDIVLEIADTLQRVHHRNRVHGDLSPDRILLGADGKVWLFGFGTPPGARHDHEWLAPERREGGEATAATDQWYLGVLAAGLVTGLTPYQSDDQAARGDVDTVLSQVEGQWPALGRLLRRMTEVRPENRFPTMHPVRQELLALSRKAGGRSERRELGAKLTEPRARALAAAAARDRSDEEPEAPVEEEAETQIIDASNAQELLAELGLLEDAMGVSSDASSPLPEPDGFTADTPLPPPPDDDTEESEEEAMTDPDPLGAAGLKPPLAKLPEEPFPVVRPDVADEVPVATLGRLVAGPDDDAPPEAESDEIVPEADTEPSTPSVGFAPQFQESIDLTDDEDSEESATVIFRADDIADITDEYFGKLEGGAATAVPATDSGEGSPDTDPTSPDLETTDEAPSEPSQAQVSPQAPAQSSDLLRMVAPVLVLMFVGLLVLWFVLRML